MGPGAKGEGTAHHGADAPRLPNRECLPGHAVWRLELFAGCADNAPPDAGIQGIERFSGRRINVERDLRAPPGNRFEHLRGKLKDWRSIRVNRQYRLIFQWEAGAASKVYLDPHTYR